MNTKVILALTTVSACLPSLATVRLQRKEQGETQKGVLLWSGLIAFLTVYGAIKNETIMWIGIILMVLTYLYFLFAPIEVV